VNDEKTIMELLEELKNDPDFIVDPEAREKAVFSLMLVMIEL
jgi:hypothetical protein